MFDLVASAWQTIMKHRLRSVLAILGVAVGVCALTSIMSVENSWRRAVVQFFSSMDLETVKVILPAGSNWRERGFRRGQLELSDVEAIRATCPAIKSVTPMQSGIVRAETHDSSLEVAVSSVEADFTNTLPDKIREGRLFTSEEVSQRLPVCLLSFEARIWLFGDEPVINQPIRLDGHRFTIIGVISGSHHTGISTRTVYIPFGLERNLIASDTPFSPNLEIIVRTSNPKAASNQIEKLFRERLGGDGSRPFTASLWQAREAALRARMRVTLYSSLAGLCALLAAGIGIAALLFVSVAERSQEIGIRRALGATRETIYGEYVLAAALLALLGGALGGILGIPASAVGAFASRWQPVMDSSGASMLLPEGVQLPGLSEIAFSVSWGALGIAILLALLTGAMAALAPASEAAAVHPASAIARRAGAQVRPRKLLTCLQVAFGVLVLILLTSYYSLLENQERAEARMALGEDKISAAADPIAALRKPFERRFLLQCRDAMAAIITSPEKIAALRQGTPLLTSLTPSVPLWMDMARGGNVASTARVVFTTAEVFHYKPFMPKDINAQVVKAFRAGQAVTVISPDAKEKLFGTSDAIGKTITIAGRKFTVLAVRSDAENTFGMAGSAFVPIEFYHMLKHRGSEKTIYGVFLINEAKVYAQPRDPRQYTQAISQLRDALLPLLPEKYRKTIKFSENIPETTRQFIFQHRAVAVRGAVGALAVLLVALIGLANMLLVSIYESMRETGLRRALGAQKSDVFLQFMSEGVWLSAIGAVTGLALGAGICYAARTWGGLPITLSAFWTAAGVVATVLAGMVISLPPAVIAARAQPVEALRYE